MNSPHKLTAQAATPSPSCCTAYTIYCHIVYADLSVLCRLPAHKSVKKTINLQPLWVNKKSIRASEGIEGEGNGGGGGGVGGLSGQFGARLGPIVINKCALRAALALKYSHKYCLTNSRSCHLLSPAPAPAPFCCLDLNQFCTFEMR